MWLHGVDLLLLFIFLSEASNFESTNHFVELFFEFNFCFFLAFSDLLFEIHGILLVSLNDIVLEMKLFEFTLTPIK